MTPVTRAQAPAPVRPRRPRLTLEWHRTETGCLYRFSGIDLASPQVAGISGLYLVGVGAFLARSLEIGLSNDLGGHLAAVRRELAGRTPDGLRNLSVTWAAAPPEHQDDMLRYLANTLHPLRISRQGANFRTAEPWPVNIPPEFRAAGPELDT